MSGHVQEVCRSSMAHNKCSVLVSGGPGPGATGGSGHPFAIQFPSIVSSARMMTSPGSDSLKGSATCTDGEGSLDTESVGTKQLGYTTPLPSQGPVNILHQNSNTGMKRM